MQTQVTPGTSAAYSLRAAVLTACCAAAILALRRPIAFLHPQFFAEDAAVFFTDAERSPLASILTPYAGYLHVGIRIVAALASPLDPRWIPAAYFGASFLAFTALELALFSSRLTLPRPWVLGLAFVMVPHSGEVFDNLTNVQWVSGLGLVLLALARDPEGPAQRSFDLGFAAVASLTGVFSILFAPLFALRAAAGRSADSAWLACLVTSGAAIQAYELIRAPDLPASALTLTPVVSTFGARVWLGLLVTPDLSDAAPTWVRASVGIVGFVLLVGLALGPLEGRRKVGALASALLAVVAGTFYKFRGILGALSSVRAGDRYFLIPKVCLIWILVFHLGAESRWRWPARILLAAILLNGCLGFRFETWENYNWPFWARRIREEDRVVVPINPRGFRFTHEKAWDAGGNPQ